MVYPTAPLGAAYVVVPESTSKEPVIPILDALMLKGEPPMMVVAVSVPIVAVVDSTCEPVTPFEAESSPATLN